MNESNDLIGKQVEQYRIEDLVGDGGMGTVYRAVDVNLGRPVAVKFMHPHFARLDEFRSRITQEARTAAKLDHPSIVKIYSFGESEYGLFIAMEYVDGGSLRAHLRRLQTRGRYLPLAQSLQIGVQIADALGYAHERGIIHRDVKPGNIILKRLDRPQEEGDAPFRAVLTDFGLVKVMEAAEALTQTGTTLGTPAYMAPEQCEGDVRVDGRSDLYALGAVLYELVTNAPPFQFKTLSEAVSTHLRGVMPKPASHFRPDIPPILDNLMQKALAKAPEERFASGEEMALVLRGAQMAFSGRPTRVMTSETSAVPPPLPEGFHLVITASGQTPSRVALSRRVISLGRSGDNDIVLPADGVSRYHARLQAAESGWVVIDLGGVNGTFMDESRLPGNQMIPLSPGDEFAVGPYALRLEAPLSVPALEPIPPARTPTGLRTMPVSEQPTEIMPAEVLAVFLSQDRITVEPGQPTIVNLEVANRGETADRVNLRVHGLPPSWVTLPDEFVTVPPGGSAQLAFTVLAPRRSDTPVGRQRFQARVVSQQHPLSTASANGSLLIGSFHSFTATLEDGSVRLPGSIQVNLQNTGNSTADFSVVGHDPIGRLEFRGESGHVPLEPGQGAMVELAIRAASTTMFGRPEPISFEVEVASRQGGRQRLAGRAIVPPVVPPLLVYAAIVVVTFGCIFGAAYVLFGDQIRGGAPRPTTSAVAAATLTFPAGMGSGAIAATATAGQATAAVASITAAAVSAFGDVDQDGLSGPQEAIARTDPNRPDTDGDGLIDGREVLELGTDPLKRDTDDDGLSDGDEVTLFGTNPRRADTDGDGVPDRVEIEQGTNPLATMTSPGPSVTVTGTALVVATASPTTGATASATAGTTSTVTPTSTQGPTATPTATPAASPSATPSLTPSPSATPSPQPTATATMTQLPAPPLTCLAASPSIDGVVLPSEWGLTPLFSAALPEASERTVELFVSAEGSDLVLAVRVADDTQQATDSITIYFDTNANGGDPDFDDRFFQISRGELSMVRAGLGTNTDGELWNSAYSSSNWGVAVTNVGSNGWAMEMVIDAAAEMPALSADRLPLLLQVLFTNEGLLSLPPAASSSNATTWQPVTNVPCP